MYNSRISKNGKSRSNGNSRNKGEKRNKEKKKESVENFVASDTLGTVVTNQ